MSKWNWNKKEEDEERMILSIDGGGIRGIIPAMLLSYINNRLKELKDNRPLYSHFDFIAGTSTGAIISAALSYPISPTSLFHRQKGDDYKVYKTEKKLFFKKEKILVGTIPQLIDIDQIKKLYIDHCEEIFEPKIKFFGSIFSEKYSERSLEFFLHRMFQAGMMNDLIIPTAIVSYSPKEGTPFIFKSYEPNSFLIREALRATSAAPMYFSPCTLKNDTLIDGGVFANNPALLSYIEAKKLYPNCKKFHILSLSTLSNKVSVDVSNIGGGIAAWAEPITKIYGHALMETIDMGIKANPEIEYTRIWDFFAGEKIKMDDVRPESLNALEALGKELIERQKENLDKICLKLSERKLPKEFPLEIKNLPDKIN